jgi:hypothetical protein
VQHVLWIGGPPGSGKTSIAGRIARRNGLRLYSADTRTWAHRDQALRAGLASAQRWELLAPTQRWERPPDELLDLSLHYERGPMVIEDLRSLPVSPLIVAEGSTLPASAVSSGIAEPHHVVWLLPTVDFQEAQLAAAETQAGPARLYRLLRQLAEQEVRQHGVPTLAVDGSRSLSETVVAVEQLFREVLATGPRATTLDGRRHLLRETNEAIVAQVRGYWARRPRAEGDPSLVVRMFACECGAPDCDLDVRLTVGQASAGPALQAGHT